MPYISSNRSNKMFSILVTVTLFVNPLFAITLPNGFNLDEKAFLNIAPRVNNALERCESPISGCSNDCTAELYCSNKNHIVTESFLCGGPTPYCVKNSSIDASCNRRFPMSNQVCLTRAINNFICTADGQFPDPTDCSKYHICKGAAHSIAECPGRHVYADNSFTDNAYTDPGSGEFSCRFASYESCDCNYFSCGGDFVNTFVFRGWDFFHYAYCLKMGTTEKVAVFKCPPGTRHFQSISMTGSVDCVPIGTPWPV